MQEDSKFKTSLYRLARSAASKEKGKDGGRGLGSILRLVRLPKGVCEALRAISSNEGGERSKWVQAFTFLTSSKTQYRHFVGFTVNCM